MFQFRRFPAYAYFVQRTLTDDESVGLPHSEISGSMRMCRSPKLIAACRVLRRLLMPRHSPCALSSLIYFREPFRKTLCILACLFRPWLRCQSSSYTEYDSLFRLATDEKSCAIIAQSFSSQFLSCFSNYAGIHFGSFRNCNCFTLLKKFHN